ncbi:hypothetical protein Y788_18930 [Pantoea dispersa 625]|nr:hypothetical protein Y788_18930 [Pantoea dispersa 625]
MIIKAAISDRPFKTVSYSLDCIDSKSVDVTE